MIFFRNYKVIGIQEVSLMGATFITRYEIITKSGDSIKRFTCKISLH